MGRSPALAAVGVVRALEAERARGLRDAGAGGTQRVSEAHFRTRSLASRGLYLCMLESAF